MSSKYSKCNLSTIVRDNHIEYLSLIFIFYVSLKEKENGKWITDFVYSMCMFFPIEPVVDHFYCTKTN